MRSPNFESDEKDFQAEIEPALRSLRANVGPCPHPDQLMAVSMGVELDMAENVREHLAVCPICRQLSADLLANEYPALSEEEDRRIRARLPQPPALPARHVSWRAWFWPPVPLAVAATILAVVVVGGVLELRTPMRVEQSAKTPELAPAPQVPQSIFVLEKAAIKVPAAAVLTYRSGTDSGKVFLDNLASALTPYRADDYLEATGRLEALATKYPQAVEPHFYLGVSYLFLNQNDKAVGALSRARPLAGDDIRDDVSWYLAIALERTGRKEDARHEAANLCSHSGAYQQKACAASQDPRR